MDRAAKLELLDRLEEQLVAAARARIQPTPPPEIHVAMVELVFARHYARLGCADRAARSLADARARLPADPVYDLLLDIVSGGPDDLASRLERLERSERYVVNLFRECVLLLDAGAASDLHALETFAPADGSAEQDARDRLAAIHAATGDVDSAILDVFRNNRALPIEGQRRLFEPALDVIERANPNVRGFMFAFAIEAAVAVAPGRLEELVERALPLLPILGHEVVFVPLLNVLVEALGRAHPQLLAKLWRALPSTAHDYPQYIAGLIYIGDADAFPRYHAFVTGPGPATQGLLRRAVLDHYLALPLAERFAEPWLVPLFARTNDSIGTNGWLSASVIALVDRVVASVVEATDD